MPTSPHLVTTVLRAISWHRRGLAAIAAACAVLLLYAALRGADAAGVPALATSRAVAAGAVVTAADLRVITLPPEALPQGALSDPRAIVGRTAAAGLPGNALLTELSVVAPRPVSTAGRATVPIRVRDPVVVGLLRPGDRVDVYSADATGATRRLARDAVVVTLPAAPAGSGPLDMGGSDQAAVLVAVDDAAAAGIAESSGEVVLVIR